MNIQNTDSNSLRFIYHLLCRRSISFVLLAVCFSWGLYSAIVSAHFNHRIIRYVIRLEFQAGPDILRQITGAKTFAHWNLHPLDRQTEESLLAQLDPILAGSSTNQKKDFLRNLIEMTPRGKNKISYRIATANQRLSNILAAALIQTLSRRFPAATAENTAGADIESLEAKLTQINAVITDLRFQQKNFLKKHQYLIDMSVISENNLSSGAKAAMQKSMRIVNTLAAKLETINRKRAERLELLKSVFAGPAPGLIDQALSLAGTYDRPKLSRLAKELEDMEKELITLKESQYKESHPFFVERKSVFDQKMTHLYQLCRQEALLIMQDLDGATDSPEDMAVIDFFKKSPKSDLEEYYSIASRLEAAEAAGEKLAGKISTAQKKSVSARPQSNHIRLLEKTGPVAETNPSGLPPPSLLLIALFGGGIALTLTILVDQFDDRIHHKEKLKSLKGVFFLAEIPPMDMRKVTRLKQSLAGDDGEKAPLLTSEMFDVFNFLHLRIKDFAQGSHGQCIAILSPEAKTGKSFVAKGLACALARIGKKTLLLTFEGKKPDPGGFDVPINATIHPEALCVETPPKLDAGVTAKLHAICLQNPAGGANGTISSIPKWIRERYDYCVIDCSKDIIIMDSIHRALSDDMDCAVMVAKASFTRLREVKNFRRHLGSISSIKIGSVLNNVPRKLIRTGSV